MCDYKKHIILHCHKYQNHNTINPLKHGLFLVLLMTIVHAHYFGQLAIKPGTSTKLKTPTLSFSSLYADFW